MKKGLVFLFAAMAGSNLMAATLHVDLNSTNPTPPYVTRETAATNIQTAVNAAVAGDTVQVWDGHYLLASEITVSKAITVKSVNGPDTTILDGQGKRRCFNLGNTSCVIEGLTITNGYICEAYSTGSPETSGGGIYCSGMVPVVTNCIITGNAADNGGGMVFGTANNCILSGNYAYRCGGGMSAGKANNCILSGNSAEYGGGMYNSTANNCTITGNSATDSGGGMVYGTANNCIVWYNSAPSEKNLSGTTANFSCSPDVTHDINHNITNAPILVSSSLIAADSPCWGAGSAVYASGTDIDGEAWANPPSMGCDEPADLPIGDIEVYFVANELVVALGYPIRFREQIHGVLSEHVWDFGDGTRVTNSPSVEHAWATSGTFSVMLTAYNADWTDGIAATQEVSIFSLEESTIHVSPHGDDANDGISWASAKATIQAGVDAQIYPGGFVLLDNGTYSLSTTITVSNPIFIVGVDGPESTIVDGQGGVGCFNLGNTACVIDGMTITNGYGGEYGYGGGIYCSARVPVVTNCIISGNSAYAGGGMYRGTANHCIISENSATWGGGMYRGTANNCTISGNTADYGGGVNGGMANHCTISRNTASSDGGGMRGGTANNCIVWYNTAPSEKDFNITTARYSCSPDAAHGVDGNITNAPVFVDAANGNYRLNPNSPCINMGDNAVVVGSVDLDGLPRIAGGVVDMGAYEYQGAGIGDQDCDGLPDNWEVDYFGDTSSMRSSDDSDMDLIDNWSEWIAGTNPSDPDSVFTASLSPNQVSADGFVVEWLSVEDRTYSVLWRGSLTNAHEVLQDEIEYPQNSYTDTVHNAESTGFYQIGVQLK